MLRLMILRHAKSSWDNSTLKDMDRPLAARRRLAAQAMGRFLLRIANHPDLVLCSSASRTQETLQIMSKELPWVPPPVFDNELYDFGDGGSVLSAIIRLAGLSEDKSKDIYLGE